jgi:hypothetical protein
VHVLMILGGVAALASQTPVPPSAQGCDVAPCLKSAGSYTVSNLVKTASPSAYVVALKLLLNVHDSVRDDGQSKKLP